MIASTSRARASPRPHVFCIELFDLLSLDPTDADGKAVTMHVRIAGVTGNAEASVTVTARSGLGP